MMASKPEPEENIVYVTGFGPFPPYDPNASQLVVKRLADLDLESRLNIKLKTEIVNVEYKDVMSKIPKRWNELKPKLVIHVGVSGQAQTITLEKQAFNCKYDRNDVTHCTLDSQTCVKGGCDTLKTGLCLEDVVSCINKLDDHVKCSLSTDPGNYLCGYIYYTSLHIDSACTVFIHVPDIKTVSPDNVADTLVEIIAVLYKQVLNNNNQVEN